MFRLTLLLLTGLMLETVTTAQVPSDSTQPPQRPPQGEAEKERSGYEPLLDLPPLPNDRVTLIGGIVDKLDPIRDRMAVRPFGGGDINIAYDVRTKIYRDGMPGSSHDLKPGRRVYVDTMLHGDRVFAKTIRIQTAGVEGDTRGQVISYDSRHGVLMVREDITPEPFKLRVTPQTKVEMKGRSAEVSEINPGAIVIIHFQPGVERGVARDIRVLANPGQSFTFYGKVTFLDLRERRIAVANQTDGKTYDIALDRMPTVSVRNLRMGTDAKVSAVFDGTRYEANAIEVVRQGLKAE